MDPESTKLAVGGALVTALGGKELLLKVLGPTFDYLGGGLKGYAEKGVHNIKRVFVRAGNLLGEASENDSVPPRVLKEVLEEGYFCEDPLMADYFGGVLASARGKISRDDRAAGIIKEIAQLSSYQVRAHYIFYEILRRIYIQEDRDLTEKIVREHSGAFVPMESFAQAMDFQETEELTVLLQHIFTGFRSKSLIEGRSGFGDEDEMKAQLQRDLPPGIFYRPSLLGLELFMWAHGHGNHPINEFLNPSLTWPETIQLTLPSDARGVTLVGEVTSMQSLNKLSSLRPNL